MKLCVLQDDLNLCILCMFEGTFLLDAAHITAACLITALKH